MGLLELSFAYTHASEHEFRKSSIYHNNYTVFYIHIWLYLILLLKEYWKKMEEYCPICIPMQTKGKYYINNRLVQIFSHGFFNLIAVL